MLGFLHNISAVIPIPISKSHLRTEDENWEPEVELPDPTLENQTPMRKLLLKQGYVFSKTTELV